MKNIDSFEDSLDLKELEDITIKYDAPIFDNDKKVDAENDYRFLRDKMRSFMASGEFILNKSVNALNSDPTPRMIEASSLILRNILKISENILNLHEKTKIILKDEKNEDEIENKKDEKNITMSLVDIINEIQKNTKNKKP